MELTGQDFVQHINYAANVWLPARSIVEEAVAKRFEVNKTDYTFFFLLQFCN